MRMSSTRRTRSPGAIEKPRRNSRRGGAAVRGGHLLGEDRAGAQLAAGLEREHHAAGRGARDQVHVGGPVRAAMGAAQKPHSSLVAAGSWSTWNFSRYASEWRPLLSVKWPSRSAPEARNSASVRAATARRAAWSRVRRKVVTPGILSGPRPGEPAVGPRRHRWPHPAARCATIRPVEARVTPINWQDPGEPALVVRPRPGHPPDGAHPAPRRSAGAASARGAGPRRHRVHGAAGAHTVGQVLDSTETDGFLVLHHGRILAERYGGRATEATPHLLQSVSKSLTSGLVGVLAGEGLLDPDAPVTDYVEELRGGSFEGCTCSTSWTCGPAPASRRSTRTRLRTSGSARRSAAGGPGRGMACRATSTPTWPGLGRRSTARGRIRVPVDPHGRARLGARACRRRHLREPVRAPCLGPARCRARRRDDHRCGWRVGPGWRAVRDPARPRPLRADAPRRRRHRRAARAVRAAWDDTRRGRLGPISSPRSATAWSMRAWSRRRRTTTTSGGCSMRIAACTRASGSTDSCCSSTGRPTR